VKHQRHRLGPGAAAVSLPLPLPIPFVFAAALALAAVSACQPGTSDAPSGPGGAGGGGNGGGSAGSGGAAAGSGGSAGGGMDAAMPDLPPDAPEGLPAGPAAADIAAFLSAGGYKQAPWISETSAPRMRMGGTSVHEKVRVWMNPPLVTSLKAGRDGLKPMGATMANPPHDRGSMAVKELYDEAGATLLGVAAMYKIDEGTSDRSWVYFCHGPEGRCLNGKASPPEAPIHGRGTTVGCGFCHGGLIYPKAP
jgi:hypothetical protein